VNLKTPADVENALTSARQTLMILRSQVQAGQVERDYFIQRLDALSQLLEALSQTQREQAGSQGFNKLYEVSRALGASLDLDEVLKQVMDAIIALSGAERGILMLLNDDGELEVRSARNFDQETLNSDELALSRTINRQVFEQGEAVLTTNAAEDPRYAGQASIVANQLRSIMAVPLRVRGKIIGVVYVDNRIRSSLFRESDLQLLDAFAAQAAVAIENARLFEETDEKLARRVEELTTLQWIDRQLNENLDMSKASELTVNWVLRLSKAQSAALALFDASHKELNLVASNGQPHPLMQIGRPLSSDHALVKQVLQTGQAAQSMAEDGTTLFAVPIRREKQTIGLILLHANAEAPLDKDMQALLARISDRAASAIENGRLYTEVKAANLAKSEFVSMVAHELKSPMTSIRGYADLMLQLGNLEGSNKDFVERIRASVERMETLVQDLSDVSRIESGHLRIDLTEVDLREVLAEAKAGTIMQIEERGHRYEEDLPAVLPKVRADPARAVQIFLNLLSNAYKYTPNGGLIRLQVRPEGDMVWVSVQDTGIGLSPEELNNLGKKFWRSSNEHALKQRGTGLGFSITRQLIELMGGKLTIHSELGKGSTFTVGLPISHNNKEAA